MAFRRKPRKKDFEEYLNKESKLFDPNTNELVAGTGNAGTRLRKIDKEVFDEMYEEYLKEKGFEI